MIEKNKLGFLKYLTHFSKTKIIKIISLVSFFMTQSSSSVQIQKQKNNQKV